MTVLEEVERVFPGSRLVRTTEKETPMDTPPPDAEKIAVVEALRHAYRLVAAQKELAKSSAAQRYLGSALEHIKIAAEFEKA